MVARRIHFRLRIVAGHTVHVGVGMVVRMVPGCIVGEVDQAADTAAGCSAAGVAAPAENTGPLRTVERTQDVPLGVVAGEGMAVRTELVVGMAGSKAVGGDSVLCTPRAVAACTGLVGAVVQLAVLRLEVAEWVGIGLMMNTDFLPVQALAVDQRCSVLPPAVLSVRALLLHLWDGRPSRGSFEQSCLQRSSE